MSFVPIGRHEAAMHNGYSYFRRMTRSGWEYFHWSGIESKWVKFDPANNRSVVEEFEKLVQL